MKGQTENVVPLFGDIEVPLLSDPLEELLAEAYLIDEGDDESEHFTERRDLVLESHYPEQSMYILDKQLESLKESLKRIRFYLGDVDDLIPG